MTTRRLFTRVQPDSVIRVALTRGMGANERVWGSRTYGAECADFGPLLSLVLSLESPGYVDAIRSQPYTWDFDKDEARAYTPLRWMLTVIERRDDGTHHLTNLSIYDLGDGGEYEAVLSEGDPAFVWHYNYWRIERQHCDEVMCAIERTE